jgi:potassium efflux system protein
MRTTRWPLMLVAATLVAAVVLTQSSADDVAAVLFSLALITAATAAHWVLRRIGRRLPRLLAQRAGRAATADVRSPWEGALQLVLLLAKLALWIGVLAFVSERFTWLCMLRQMLGHAVMMAVTAPLFAIDDRHYRGIDLLELPALLIALWVAANALTRVLKTQVLEATGMERGAREAVTILARYTLVFLGAIVILQIWGIDATSLTFVASVLGVGIGFGLQHIANNFVSGLLISVERPIQPGDFVKVGEWTGTVERVGPRHTEIRTLDNVSILVPNSKFLETEVVNWTHNDPVSRIHLPVGVAYGSAVARVRAALLEVARSHPAVLRDPRPRVEFRGFGDSALSFDLEVWTRDPRNQLHLKSDLYYRIEANLRRHRIQIPFPQRDLHLRAPQVDQLLAAWSRRHFTEAELTSRDGDEHDDLPAIAPADAEFDETAGRRHWSDHEIAAVVAGMRSPGGVGIADRRHLLTVYRQCFVGRAAVDWLARSYDLTRREAVELGQLLVDRGTVRHVLDEHGFKDADLFYRFTSDEATPPAAGATTNAAA